jgi:hypothetical protein
MGSCFLALRLCAARRQKPNCPMPRDPGQTVDFLERSQIPGSGLRPGGDVSVRDFAGVGRRGSRTCRDPGPASPRPARSLRVRHTDTLSVGSIAFRSVCLVFSLGLSPITFVCICVHRWLNGPRGRGPSRDRSASSVVKGHSGSAARRKRVEVNAFRCGRETSASPTGIDSRSFA